MRVSFETHSWLNAEFTYVTRVEIMNGAMHVKTETGEFRLPVNFEPLVISVITPYESRIHLDGNFVAVQGGFGVKYVNGYVEVYSVDNVGFWGRGKALVANECKPKEDNE